MRSLFHNSIFIHVTIIWVMFWQPHCWGIKYVTSLSLLGDSLTRDNLVLWLSNAFWKWLLLSEFQENVKWYQHSSLQWNLECDWLVGFYDFSSSPINKQKFPRTLKNVIENVYGAVITLDSLYCYRYIICPSLKACQKTSNTFWFV